MNDLDEIFGEKVRYCCLLDCSNSAEFAIFGNSGHPDDHTDACIDHVGHLLGTPINVSEDNRSWQVVHLSNDRWFGSI